MDAGEGTAADTPRWLGLPEVPAMPEAAERGLRSINGIEMYVARYGDHPGTPVLMIHGGLAHADTWAAQVADLMQSHTVYVADTRGHGRSGNDGSAYNYERLAADYLGLLDALGIDKVHIVGWSDGANIGFLLSRTAPQRVASHFAHAGNVALDGVDPGVESNALFGQYIGKMASDYAGLSPTPEGFEAFVGEISTMWMTEKAGGLEALSAVEVPTVVVQSEHDEAILPAHAAAIAAALPNGELLTLPRVSHFAAFQAPEEYNATIRAFLARVG